MNLSFEAALEIVKNHGGLRFDPGGLSFVQLQELADAARRFKARLYISASKLPEDWFCAIAAAGQGAVVFDFTA